MARTSGSSPADALVGRLRDGGVPDAAVVGRFTRRGKGRIAVLPRLVADARRGGGRV